ncbi:hypothetical protein LCH21_00460 [Patescibacteria group bacterium]|nr:hypothetical protein [Patescibacteria group bacterium]
MRKIGFSQKQFALLCAVVLVVVSVVAMIRQSGWMSDAQRELDGNTTKTEPQKTETADKADTVEQKDTAKKDDSNTQLAAKGEQPEAKVTPQDSYAYTAKSGDSYTALARDAIAQYAKAKKIEVTAAQQLQAEVELVNAASAPLLDIGQTVSITKDAVARALQAAGAVAATSVTEQKQTTTPTADANKGTANDYSVQAKAGDSYILLARSAVTKHMKDNKVTLTGAQRIAAETTLGVAAGLPAVEVGQNVTFTKTALQQAVDAAKSLSIEQQAVWAPYAAGVIFE